MVVNKHQSLILYNTFGIDKQAETINIIESETELEQFFAAQPAHWLILGGGSNILLTQDVSDPVLKIAINGIELMRQTEHWVEVKVGAGEIWHQWVLYSIAQGWGGMENLSLIPGSVGAAPIQNIGAYGVEVASVIEKVRYYDIEKKTWAEIRGSDCAFGYRDSIFKKELKGKFVITAVYFRLHKAPHSLNIGYGAIKDELNYAPFTEYSIKDVSDAVIRIRQSKLPDPKDIGNSGSFFKNPVISQNQFDALVKAYPRMPFYSQPDGFKIPAAWLIEQCGWKGRRKGHCGVHDKQALVLVNYGGASGMDIYRLSGEIIQSVEQKFGISLEREVQII